MSRRKETREEQRVTQSCSCLNSCQRGSGSKRKGCPCKDARSYCGKHCTCGTKMVCKNKECCVKPVADNPRKSDEETDMVEHLSGSLNLDDGNNSDSNGGSEPNTPNISPSKKAKGNMVRPKAKHKKTDKITAQTGLPQCQLHQIKNGYALIIHNIEFTGCNLDNRKGSLQDLKAIKIFCKAAGLIIDIQENLEVKGIRAHCCKLNKGNTFKNLDGFVCFILSHGNSSGVYGKYGDIISVKEIVGYFTENNDLLGKPKLFFIQACRGDGIEDDGADDDPNVRLCPPDSSDILIAHSTMEGDYSFRNINTGSWFIQTLMKKLDAYAKTNHLLDIMIEVNGDMAGSDFMGERQMPVQISTLTKYVYFNQYA